eukprot:TRINITY_DN25349_c0_g1_i1.p1 TRINITY_DN25349_c0_g1~~TRINITY_DN25349_c0_g1_i1.p1  ORF type:complete len:153 (+),score=40.28 TRINITY_DN25349_c0_g1_i1:70-528(+)
MMKTDKRVLYVGGLADKLKEHDVRAAFIPFGDILSLELPTDAKSGEHKGFAFVTYESKEDAEAAVDNMDKGELYGRTLHVNVARPKNLSESAGVALWSNDEYYQKFLQEGGDEPTALIEKVEQAVPKSEESAKKPAEGQPEGQPPAKIAKTE